MNDDHLRRQLQKMPVPSPSEAARERARHRALVAFQHGAAPPPQPQFWRGFGWGLAVAAVAIACVIPVLFSLHHPEASENLASDRQMLHQLEQLFPGQVDAVVQEHGKTDLAIAQTPGTGSGQPLVITFRRAGETIRVLSYSGHRVCVKLGQTENCFDVLATPSGGVILEGRDQVWLTSDKPMVSGYAVRGQVLEASL